MITTKKGFFAFRVHFDPYITASGSIFHQLLAASRKRRRITKPLEGAWAPCQSSNQKGLEPPTNQVNNKGRPFWKGRTLLERGAPFWKGRAPQQPATSHHLRTSTELSPSTPHGLGPPSSTCTNSWSILPPHTKAMGGPHTRPPFWAWNPLMRPRGLSTTF